MKKVRLAVIGLGFIGKKHAELAKQIDECALVAVSDIDETHQKAAGELGARFYAKYQEMIEKEELDGIVIAVPNELHVPVGTNCLQKGLHILMEKPIAPSLSGADSLIESERKNNVHLLVGHHRRFNPLIEVTRKIIKGGQIGRLVGVMILWTMFKPSEYFEASWRRSNGGGPILLNLIHEIDNLRYICGKITRVYAEVSNKVRKFPVEDSASVSLRFEGDAIGSILLSDCVPSVWSFEATSGENPYFFHRSENCYYFFGTEATLTFPPLKKLFYPNHSKVGWQYPISVEDVGVYGVDPYQEQLRHFCKVIKGEETPRTTGEDARKTLEVTLSVIKSGEIGQPISSV